MASRYEKFTIKTNPDRQGLWLKCIFCGKRWSPAIKLGGRLARNAFVCPNGCTKDYKVAYKKLSEIVFTRNHKTGRFEPVIKK